MRLYVCIRFLSLLSCETDKCVDFLSGGGGVGLMWNLSEQRVCCASDMNLQVEVNFSLCLTN
jgi:hypothetical protein